MASTDNGDNAASTPLDAERAKLKAQGYTDAEISQILIARAVGGQHQSAGATGQGVMSNTLSSIVAIAGHARGLIPTFGSDFATIFGRGAPFGSRLGSMFSLIAKTAVVGVLAYAGWQEWQQHIISATAIADSEVRKRHAEECSARMKNVLDTVPMDKIVEATEIIQRDCDPTYAARARDCDTKFQAILDEITQANMSDADKGKQITDKIAAHRASCIVTDEQRKLAADRIAAIEKNKVAPPKLNPAEEQAEKDKVETALKAMEALGRFHDLESRLRSAMAQRDYARADDLVKAFGFYVMALKEITEAEGKSDYTTALKSAEILESIVESPYIVDKDKQPEEREGALISISWLSLLTKDFARALNASEKAVALNPSDLVPKTNQAHALLLLGRVDEATAIYLANRGKLLLGKTWEAVVQDDFEKLRKQGISTSAMDDVTAMLKASTSVQPSAPVVAQPTSPTAPKAAPPAASKPVPPTTSQSFTAPPTVPNFIAGYLVVTADKLPFLHCDSASHCVTARYLTECTRLKVEYADRNYRKPESGLMGVSQFVGGITPTGGYDYGMVDAAGVGWEGYVKLCRR
jgi:tetratricopeptide (TPR) repeat protein